MKAFNAIMRWAAILSLPVVLATVSASENNSPDFIDSEKVLRARFGPALQSLPQEIISCALVELAERLPVGGALKLPTSVPTGRVDFRRVADHVQITGGRDGTVIFGGGQNGLQLLFSDLDHEIDQGLPRKIEALRRLELAGDFKNERIFGNDFGPASDLLAMFCNGGIHIKSDVRNCAWIAGANAFGSKTVTASARVDGSLFLWFGINWTFADYNGHLDPKFKNKDWLENAQMWFDCKGGGEGTRLYMMIETNYGNPGPGVVLQNCKGMSLYHGSTERGSAQGPGMYWLKNCENVQLGLRRVFSATRSGARGVVPTHDITIEGGRANILHNIEFFGNAQQETIVNTDPELQVWSVSCDFESSGLDGKDILRFAYTPNLNRPEGEELEKVKSTLSQSIEQKIKVLKLEPSEEIKRRLETHFLSGRDGWYRLNARAEVTFGFGIDDLTKAPAALSTGRTLPPPPSMPATNAPRVNRPIAFTQEDGFGKALLDAGADPTGKTPSDDAFAKFMFGMTRNQVQVVLEQTYSADAKFRAAKAANDSVVMKVAQESLEAAMLQLQPLEPEQKPDSKKKPRGVKREPLNIPPGTFVLKQPLVLTGGWKEVWGAGPERTTLKADGDFKVVEQHEPGTLANFSIEGGRVGLAITGSDHDKPFSPTLHSYIAGQNYFNLTFRNQTFAGIHVGNDVPELMGGAEHDQNKYVQLKFINTGSYGIFMNQNMLDKWLCLHCEFSGQSRAGISIKFNNLIHGSIVSCSFSNINGPGLDFMGGNPEIRFRSHQVMIDQCTFTECGNASEPAVDQGAGVCMAFAHSRIETKNKKILTGYRGGAAIYEDVTVDVTTIENGPAMILRAARQNQTCRPNGHTLRDIKSSGSVAFVNDANAYNAAFAATCKERNIDPNLNWDCNPAAHELKPDNGWVHPFVMYNCHFGEKRVGYSLMNVDMDTGKVIQTIDLTPYVRAAQ